MTNIECAVLILQALYAPFKFKENVCVELDIWQVVLYAKLWVLISCDEVFTEANTNFQVWK